jgi:hypothetical protein
MKNKFILLILFPFIIACEDVEIGKPISTNIDTTMYTIEGRYLNGTTNKPYRNIELTLIMDNYGYPRILKDIAGPIRTDNEGYFKFTYRYIDRFPGGIYLEVFPTDLYPEIDSLPINQNINQTVYQSSFGSLILDIDPITSNELFVSTGNMDTLHYTNISGSFSDTIRNVPMNTTIVAWGRTMVELRNSLKNYSGYQKFLKMNGDPYFNKVKIQF